MGLRNARLNFRQTEQPHLMENLIYNELLYRGYNVDAGIVETNEKVNDFFKKIVIVRKDIKPYSNEQGITIMGIRYFLLYKNSLEF